MSLFSPSSRMSDPIEATTTRPSSSSSIRYGSPSQRTSSLQPGGGSIPLELSSFSLDENGLHPHHHYDVQQRQEETQQKWQHLYVLPVLLLEFLALALTRAVLPGLLLQQYDTKVYLVMGMAECVRGFLAFFSCPMFGKLSDLVGRRICLFVTVAGTCAPVCSLALLFSSFNPNNNNDISTSLSTKQQQHQDDEVTIMTIINTTTADTIVATEPTEEESGVWSMMWSGQEETSSSTTVLHPYAITIFVMLLALSGIFSSTFTLVFAYISDTVREREERVSAYGLALATFGLSFTIGPMAGGYLAQSSIDYVFRCSFLLTILDLLYIYAILPESINPTTLQNNSSASTTTRTTTTRGWSSVVTTTSLDNISWFSPWDTLRMVVVDPFLRRVGKVAFFYYTSLWAVISTLVLYAAKRFELGPERLGELMSALGLCTMIAEAVLVRIVVPILGELKSMQVGLVSFGLQCVVLGLAYEPWHLFACAAFSLLGNLVYPSLSSLVSGSVEPQAVGEALGAINGIKALTEGIGPLVFGSLMTLSEHSAVPGWPYFLAALFAYAAYQSSQELPDVQNDEYIHELELKNRVQSKNSDNLGSDDEDAEYAGLLSEIDESEDDVIGVGGTTTDNVDMTRLPITFASLMKKQQTQ